MTNGDDRNARIPWWAWLWLAVALGAWLIQYRPLAVPVLSLLGWR